MGRVPLLGYLCFHLSRLAATLVALFPPWARQKTSDKKTCLVKGRLACGRIGLIERGEIRFRASLVEGIPVGGEGNGLAPHWLALLAVVLLRILLGDEGFALLVEQLERDCDFADCLPAGAAITGGDEVERAEDGCVVLASRLTLQYEGEDESMPGGGGEAVANQRLADSILRAEADQSGLMLRAALAAD